MSIRDSWLWQHTVRPVLAVVVFLYRWLYCLVTGKNLF